MALFESYERRIDKINATLKEYGISSVEECRDICLAKGIDCDKIVRETQPICFENAVWAYTVGAAIAIKKGCVKAADAAAAIGIGLQSFCIPGSVAENRKVGLGHGNLGKMLLSEETDCFCFLAGHESFAAAEGAIKIALNANKVRPGKPIPAKLSLLQAKRSRSVLWNGRSFFLMLTASRRHCLPLLQTVPAVSKKRKTPGTRCFRYGSG